MNPRLVSGTLALLAALAASVPADAHLGKGGYTGGGYLEGEDYDTPDADCDPTGDGEHTAPVGSSHAFLPASGCGLNYARVCFASSADIDRVVVRVGGTGDAMTYTVRVLVDGALHGAATFTQRNADGWVSHDVDSAWYSIPAGVHDVRIEYTVQSGPYWANLDVEHATVFHSGADRCTPEEEVACTVFYAVTLACPV